MTHKERLAAGKRYQEFINGGNKLILNNPDEPAAELLYDYMLMDIDMAIDILEGVNTEYHKYRGADPFLKALKLIKTIKTKRDALLHIKHDSEIIRYYCRNVLKGKS